MLSVALAVVWTALVHLHPNHFFLVGALFTAVWLFTSARAIGPSLPALVAVRPPSALLGLGLGLVLYIGSRVFLWAFCGGISTVLCGPIERIYGHFGEGGIPAALALALVIAPAEELFWRGVVQGYLRSRLGRAGAVAVATLLSSGALLLAGEPLLALAAVPTSIAWGSLAEVRRSLIPSILSHALWDLLIAVLAPAR